MTATARFLNYISEATGSERGTGMKPSTEKQLELCDFLKIEMGQMGLTELHSDSWGNVYGTIPANTDKPVPSVAFIAHVDTSPDAPDGPVHPKLVQYKGGDITLENGIVIDVASYPCLNEVVGEELIVTDGTTLLGADDKAGIAEIMTGAELLLKSGKPHGRIVLIFTTDEEIGDGAKGIEPSELGCDYAYTLDGGPIGSVETETFNAAEADLTFRGVGIHTGSAKDIMVNAATVAMEFHSLLPADMVPEKTEGRQGFIHLFEMHGEVEKATLNYIIRDHSMPLFVEKKQIMECAANAINDKYGAGTVTLEISDTYFNMREKLEKHWHLVDRAKEAFRKNGVEPREDIIRGGTDGADLTWRGLPCPNLSAGGYNFHGVREFVPTAAMEKIAQVVCDLALSFAE